MTRLIVILAAALALQGTVANAGFVKGNGEVQFPGRSMPNDPETTHKSLTERSEKSKAPSWGNAWAPHIKGNREFEK